MTELMDDVRDEVLRALAHAMADALYAGFQYAAYPTMNPEQPWIVVKLGEAKAH